MSEDYKLYHGHMLVDNPNRDEEQLPHTRQECSRPQAETMEALPPHLKENSWLASQQTDNEQQNQEMSRLTKRTKFEIPDIPPTAHEIATILCFGISYKLVDWLAKRMQFASNQLA